MTEQVPPLIPPTTPDQPFFVAMIIDGIVYQVMNVAPQEAARFLANPTFVQVQQGQAVEGYHWDGTNFAPPGTI